MEGVERGLRRVDVLIGRVEGRGQCCVSGTVGGEGWAW